MAEPAHGPDRRRRAQLPLTCPEQVPARWSGPGAGCEDHAFTIVGDSAGGAPEGFAGPNDFWHTHSANGGLCIKDGIVVGSEDVSEDECTARGGRKVGLKGVYMVHNWVVPRWECSWGAFAGECPELGGSPGKDAFS